MPIDYECTACKLGFTVGFYHQHDHSDGYFGFRLLVCRGCGCQHQIHRPLSNSEQPCVLRSQPDLVIASPKRGSKLLIPFSHYTNQQFIESEDANILTCQRCHSVDALVDDWIADEYDCPNCSQPNLRQMSHWMTWPCAMVKSQRCSKRRITKRCTRSRTCACFSMTWSSVPTRWS